MRPDAQEVMRVVKKTSYEVICTNREEEINKKKLKDQMNYINVSSDSGLKIKLKNKKELRNIITEVYTAHINAIYTAAKYSSAEKLTLSKHY